MSGVALFSGGCASLLGAAASTTRRRMRSSSITRSSSHVRSSSTTPISSSIRSSRRLFRLRPQQAPTPRLLAPPNAVDYASTASDEGSVLRLPPRTELDPDELTHVFGYPRNINEHYFFGRVIGAGSFGVVREAVEAASGRRFAIKTVSKVPKRGPATPRYLLKLRAEVEAMQQLGASLDAVALHEVYEADDSVSLVMEICDGGALLDGGKVPPPPAPAAMVGADDVAEGEEQQQQQQQQPQEGPPRAASAREVWAAPRVRSVLRFIAQCHAKGIVYRDVKPDNFLSVSPDEGSHAIKATDFGLAIRHAAGEPKLTSRSGTPAYMAPELVMQCYDEKADVWSVGMLAYQLLTGRLPFWDNVQNESLSDVWKAILSFEIDWGLTHDSTDCAPELRPLTPAARAFLERLLQRNPAERPSAAEALGDGWFAEMGLLLPAAAASAGEAAPASAAAGGSGTQAASPSSSSSSSSSTSAAFSALGSTVVARLQRFATLPHLKQLALRMVAEEMRRGRSSSNGSSNSAGAINGASAATADFATPADAAAAAAATPAGIGPARATLDAVFAAYDTDTNGTISFDELAAGLVRNGFDVTEDEAAQLLERIDLDHSRGVDGDEFAAALADWGPVFASGKWRELVGAVFARLDADGDGYVEVDELLSRLPEGSLAGPGGSGGPLGGGAEGEARRMLREADIDGDGRVGAAEFDALMRDLFALAPDDLELYDARIRRVDSRAQSVSN